MGVPESRSSVFGFVQVHRAGTQAEGGGTDANRGITARAAIQRAMRGSILLLYPEGGRSTSLGFRVGKQPGCQDSTRDRKKVTLPC